VADTAPFTCEFLSVCIQRYVFGQHALAQPGEIAQIRALDSLSYIIWQAHAHNRHAILNTILQELQQGGSLFQLLASASAWMRTSAQSLRHCS